MLKLFPLNAAICAVVRMAGKNPTRDNVENIRKKWGFDRPVYVLTSDTTFSGGEELCYNLKTQGRAVLIGETTRGGAHPTDAFPITPSFEITVPIARSINPVTGGNWEGTGVEPDIAAPAAEAFALAYRKALQHVLTTSTSPAVLAEARAALG